MYLRSQAGNSGQRIFRYSRAAGVRSRRDLSLQVTISRVLSEPRLKRLRFAGAGSVVGRTGAGVAGAGASIGVGSSTGVSTIGSAFGALSGTGMVALRPVGRL